MAEQFGYAGQAQAGEGVGEYGALMFLISQALARLSTSTLVRVVAVTNAGGVAPVGFVDVQPLVNQLDGAGNAVPHAVLHNLPYFRLQGGTDAIILDPKVGDIGIAVFASRDISAVKASKAQANPGSWRTHDMADGLYFGGLLNGAPVQYVQFTEGGINVVSPSKVEVIAPTVAVTASGAATVQCATSTVTATGSASVTAPTISLGAAGQSLKAFVTSVFQALFNSHTHHENGVGSETNPPTQQMNASHMTTTVKGG